MDYAPHVAPKRPALFALAWVGLVVGIVGAAIGLSLSAANVIPTPVSSVGVILSSILWTVIRSVFPRDHTWSGRALTIARVVVWLTLGVAIVAVIVFLIWTFTDVTPTLGLALTLGVILVATWVTGAIVSYLSGVGAPTKQAQKQA